MPRYNECSIYDAKCRDGVCDHIKKQTTQRQRIWLCLSGNPDQNGYFVWEVLEEVGISAENRTPHEMFTVCRNGSRVLIQCYHFFTKERAEKHIASYKTKDWLDLSQQVIRIG